MKITRRVTLAAVGAAAIGIYAAHAAGLWSTLPIVGSPSFCGSTVSGTGGLSGITGQGQGTAGSICGQTIPAGPGQLTDEELVPADTGLSGGAPPQTVAIPSGMLGALNLKVNRVIGGDFATNLWQRTTTPLTAATPTTAQMAADRWWAISANNVVTISKQTPASSAADYLGTSGFYSWMRVARPSGTPSGVTCVGETLDQLAAAPLIGNNAVLSFFGYAPTTFSATNQQITVTVAYFTAADAASGQSAVGAAGVNSKTFALSASGQGSGITGYTANVLGVSLGTGTVASGVATIPLTTTPTRYAVYAPIPSATAAGTAITAVGIAFCATPTAATTVATDYFEITGVQLQAMPGTATINLPNGIIAPTGFERRAPQIEAANELYYSLVINEGSAAADASHGVGTAITTGLGDTMLQYPVGMRIAPTIAYTAGFADTGAAGAPKTCTALASVGTPTTATALVQCTSTGNFTANQPAIFVDNGGSGVVSVSAEP